MKTDEWRDRERDGEWRGEQKGPENMCDGWVRGCGVEGSSEGPPKGCSQAQEGRGPMHHTMPVLRGQKKKGRQLARVKQMLRHHDDMGGEGRSGLTPLPGRGPLVL